MSGFDARLFDFQEVDNPDLLSERVWGKLTVRHILYLFFAIFVGWGALNSKSGVATAVSLGISLLAIVGAFYPQKSVTFEAIVFGAVMYFVNGSNVPDPSKVNRPKAGKIKRPGWRRRQKKVKKISKRFLRGTFEDEKV
ncbi:hypothetical protein [Archaeoglobus neptunius]|uniref:hypothetical protein n=1 Tax=Archaeoglobus neptunius TaxID=2798580 RepID=UPI001928F0DA|nr:hypothetical protein [Archaeoglobus neptunius]